MAYLLEEFTQKIDKNVIKTIFELGSRDLVDAYKLSKYYECDVYAFECNPDCLLECEKKMREESKINKFSNF